MKKWKRIFGTIGLLILVGGVFGALHFYMDATTYYTTENAQIAADMITITPEVTGKLKTWNVMEGDLVENNALLGQQDLHMLVSNSQLDVNSLEGSADSLLRKSEIRTPINGKIIRSNVVVGQVVSPGMSLATVADTSHYYIKANIEETDILKIRSGQGVDVWIDAYSGEHFSGMVERVGQATESAFNTLPSFNTSGEFSKVTQLIPVRIQLNEASELALMPGMNVKVKIHVKE